MTVQLTLVMSLSLMMSSVAIVIIVVDDVVVRCRLFFASQASLVVETGQAWSTHHFACLVGYGASAVHPYLAYQSVLGW